MTNNNNTSNDNTEDEPTAPDEVAIEGKLPLTAIDIESQKEMKPRRGHALQSIQKWFAFRPTAASRLAVLASALPENYDKDELLRLMQFGKPEWYNDPDKRVDEEIKKKFEEGSGGGIDERYGYDNPNESSPTQGEIDELHDVLRSEWGGELPVIGDPTAGRGTIPFEALRYDLPIKANELNPVPSLIMKTALEYAPRVGSLEEDLNKWRDEINKRAKKNLQEYHRTKDGEEEILNSAFTYVIECGSCGGKIPLVMKWWVNKNSDDAIKPIYSNDGTEITYEHVDVSNDSCSFDPDDAPVSRGDAACPHCGVVTDSDTIRERIREDDFEYSVYGVNYEDDDGEWKFRAGCEVDKKGLEKAKKRVESDFDMIDFLSEPIQSGAETHRLHERGMEQWQDVFTPRQLVTQFEFMQAHKEVAEEIRDEYTKTEFEAIQTILTLAASRAMIHNCRLAMWRDDCGYGGYVFSDNNFALKKMAVDNNLAGDRRGYMQCSYRVVKSYEELASYVENVSDDTDITVSKGDAADLTEKWGESSVDVAVVDPPYYDSIMYAELSDITYTLQKEYLSDVHPDLFESKLTNKEDEAVANPSRFDGIESDDSKQDLAEEYYESKMREIFEEQYECLSENGVLTVMFTHREMEAWDTLTSALISAGFIITATHPIKTEMTDRIGMRNDDSADSSILLIARKRTTAENKKPTLWDTVKDDIYASAEKEAYDILDSEYVISKTDTAIAAYGPSLQEFVEKHPVVDKNGEEIRPRKALSEARQATTSVLIEKYLKTQEIEKIDSLTRWYILVWLIHENDTLIYDEARQIGIAADVEIDKVKRETKIWGKAAATCN
jgi:adenine-specific DNA methylase